MLSEDTAHLLAQNQTPRQAHFCSQRPQLRAMVRDTTAAVTNKLSLFKERYQFQIESRDGF